jgi:hypothetical protein
MAMSFLAFDGDVVAILTVSGSDEVGHHRSSSPQSLSAEKGPGTSPSREQWWTQTKNSVGALLI